MKAIERIVLAKEVINSLMSYEGDYPPYLTEEATFNGVALCLAAEGHGTPTPLVYADSYEDLYPVWDTIRTLEKVRGEKYI
jgi:hypothetical protein